MKEQNQAAESVKRKEDKKQDTWSFYFDRPSLKVYQELRVEFLPRFSIYGSKGYWEISFSWLLWTAGISYETSKYMKLSKK